MPTTTNTATVHTALAVSLGISIFSAGGSGVYGNLKSYLWRSPKLEVVYEDPDAELDIVFVPNLGQSCQDTWTCDRDGESGTWWNTALREKDSQNVRVMTYCHDRVSRETAHHLPQSIRSEAGLLLDHLKKKRQHQCQDRPLVFVAHSLGGLIVKTTLISAVETWKGDNDCQSIFEATKGVVFYGTPHQRAQEPLGNYIAKIAVQTLNTELSRPLKADADLFSLQLDRYKSLEGRFTNLCFYHQDDEPSLDGHKNPGAPEWSTWKAVKLKKEVEKSLQIRSNKDLAYQQTAIFLQSCSRAEKSTRTQRQSESLSALGLPELVRHDSNNLGDYDPELVKAERLAQSADPVDRQKGETELCKILRRSEDLYGLCSTHTLSILAKQAKFHRLSKGNDKALSYYRRIHLAILINYSESILDIHPELAHELDVAAHGLAYGADILERKGQFREAMSFLRTAHSICKRCHPSSDKRTLALLDSTALLHISLGELDQADQIYEELESNHSNHLDHDHRERIRHNCDFIETRRKRESITATQGFKATISSWIQPMWPVSGLGDDHTESYLMERRRRSSASVIPTPSLEYLKPKFMLQKSRSI